MTTLYLHSHSMPIPGYTLSADLCTEMLRRLEEDQSTQHADPMQTGVQLVAILSNLWRTISAKTFYGYKKSNRFMSIVRPIVLSCVVQNLK